ncbi:MAG: alpha/beta hydrolase [Bauldia sp.]|nr:alpha/beta hydrolase [Bauldia sp.]
MNLAKTLAAAGAAALTTAMGGTMAHAQPAGVQNIVLVHGAWADGTGWRPIYEILKADGYNVSIVQNPLTSFEADVAAVDRVVARMEGPVILVGHSYGGAVITEAGDHPQVVGLVYVQAFAPDVGESTFGLIPADGPPPPIEPQPDGFVFFNKDAFLVAFAESIDPETAAFMADSQVPIAFDAGNTPLTVAAWHDKPSWYQVGTTDHVIPPAAQHLMAGRAGSTVVEVEGGHLAFIANAQATAELIEAAAAGSQ